MNQNLKEVMRLIKENEPSFFDLYSLAAELILLQKSIEILEHYRCIPVFINGESRYLAMEFLNSKDTYSSNNAHI